MTNQSPPMGRMLRRALIPLPESEAKKYIFKYNSDTPAELRWIESGRMGFAMNKTGDGFLLPLVIRRSLNTTGRAFRQRELDYIRIKYGGPKVLSTFNGLGSVEIYAHLAKPVTKKDILDGYLRAGHYFNNRTPKP